MQAYEAWRLYALVIEIKMDEGGQFAFMTDWAGKFPGQIVRIAALLHIARHAKEEPWLIDINHEDMKAAISIRGYLASHALATFDLIQEDPAVHGAKSILRWIEKNRWHQFTFRDCHYAHKNRFKKAKDMEPYIDILVGNYFIKELESEKKSSRPSRVFSVNPLIYHDET